MQNASGYTKRTPIGKTASASEELEASIDSSIYDQLTQNSMPIEVLLQIIKKFISTLLFLSLNINFENNRRFTRDKSNTKFQRRN